MNEYILIAIKKVKDDDILDTWMNHFLMNKNFRNEYDDALFCHWCDPLENIDLCLVHTYQGRYDYKNDQHLHTLYNILTKEIVIIITNRYQIIVKCDKIPIGVVKTVRNYFPNIRLFCRNKDFEEVKI